MKPQFELLSPSFDHMHYGLREILPISEVQPLYLQNTGKDDEGSFCIGYTMK